MTTDLDEKFAAGLRRALVDQVHAQPGRKPWFAGRRRWIIGAGAVVVLGAAGGGIAYAAGIWSLPGSDTVTHVATPVTATGMGTQSVDLGNPPAGATTIDIRLTCLTAGTFTVADGAQMVCGDSDLGQGSATMGYTLPVTPGLHSTTITAAASARWRLTATYSTVSTIPWGVNADGQTYGVANDHGTPDLIAAIATNGHQGYVYAAQLAAAQNKDTPIAPSQVAADQDHGGTTLTVYESDGRTAIGQFVVE